jgi:hypothetical protein
MNVTKIRIMDLVICFIAFGDNESVFLDSLELFEGNFMELPDV